MLWPLRVIGAEEPIGGSGRRVAVDLAFDERRVRYASSFARARGLRSVGEDPVQPRLERGAGVEAVDASQDGDPRLLHDVLGRRLVRDVGTCDPWHRCLVPLDERRERHLAPTPQPDDEPGVVGLTVAVATPLFATPGRCERRALQLHRLVPFGRSPPVAARAVDRGSEPKRDRHPTCATHAIASVCAPTHDRGPIGARPQPLVFWYRRGRWSRRASVPLQVDLGERSVTLDTEGGDGALGCCFGVLELAVPAQRQVRRAAADRGGPDTTLALSENDGADLAPLWGRQSGRTLSTRSSND